MKLFVLTGKLSMTGNGTESEKIFIHIEYHARAAVWEGLVN